MTAPRSYYEVLGVARDADQQELRRAYVSLARRLHPDGYVGRPDAERVTADRRMREVNEAWRVLSRADLRADYDRSLREPARPAGARPAGPPAWAREASQASAARYPEVEDVGVVAAFVKGLPWFLVVGVLGAIFVVTAFAAGDRPGPTTPTTAPDTRPELAAGDCVNLGADGVLHVVACEDPHDGQIMSLVGAGRGCQANSQMILLPERDQRACVLLRPTR